jgi:hypothetical protein
LVKARRAKRRKASIRSILGNMLLGGARRFEPRPTEGYENYVPMDAREGEREIFIRRRLLDQDVSAEARYETLFRYFLHGFAACATADGERVQYPGMASVMGYRVDGLIGFARTAPLLAAWAQSGRGTVVLDDDTGASIDLVDRLERGILAGTDPSSPAYWGEMRNCDQRIVEAADIARVLWLTRDLLWKEWTDDQRRQVADWLLQVNARPTHANNWLLFPVVVNCALGALGYQDARRDPRYDEFKGDYLDHGWYFDRPRGVDFYNAWGITYDLFWIHLLQPEFDRDFIRVALAQSAWLTSHLIAPNGIPILGRSVCYRTAVPVPVITDTFIDSAAATQGRGRRALDVVWRYFVANGSLRNGTLTQGYFGSDPRFVDAYTGPGSSHWGLRSLVLALMHGRGADFWTVPDVALPVETGDYRLDLPKLGWIVSGRHGIGEITIAIPRNRHTAISPEPCTMRMRWAEKIARQPMRPRNMAIKYDAAEYSSRRPFPIVSEGRVR